ncbi:DUF6607 family protein [Tunicatimonas pelagia]|uniref:DUF6607 family protein n=1 Tax=Tunicatimonas pelagia TaxID=931531 RepID=UPI0026656693|nr:DUF6607 family protein [Tunicatimonas pelagia]WKN44128.1 hypothetical protein P0M28_03995 [Tunicatimonas pelagia]
MKNTLITFSLAFTSLLAFGQKQQDIESIKAMCGCYEVDFQYVETFAPKATYEFHDRYVANALEWVGLVDESENKLSLQHILVMRDTMALKHWRQDWIFENQKLYSFQGDDLWNFETLANEGVKGQWTQKVYQVDDGPRYEGNATWIHTDGKHYWESTVDAPLPRREYTKRDDYNVLERTNRHEITDEGHVHEQDNTKIRRRSGKDRVLVHEKGMNVYKKVDDSRCQAAADWWQKNQAFWSDVRTAWDEVFARQQDLMVATKVDDQRLYELLFPLNAELMTDGSYNSEEGLSRIRETIAHYVSSPADTEVATGK